MTREAAQLTLCQRYAKSLGSMLQAEPRLRDLVDGRPVVLYHGTTRSFQTFEVDKSRLDMVNQFYGPGIYLTPSKRVAEKYAESNRNIGFDPEIIEALKSKNRLAGAFLEQLVTKGVDTWDEYHAILKEKGLPGYALEEYLGINPNYLSDIAGFVVDSKIKPLVGDDTTSLFSQSTGAPAWLYDLLDEVGLDSAQYRPKVYTVAVVVNKPLVTMSSAQARRARSKGYDSVVFFGSHLVDGVPEVAVFSSRNVRVLKVEVV